MESLLGGYYTALSVVIVYHLFSIQQWLDRVGQLEARASEVRQTTAVADIARTRVRSQCSLLLKRFPLIQILILLIAVTGVSYVAINLALYMNYHYLYTVVPTIILWCTFIASSISVWKQGKNTIDGIMKGL